MGIFSNILSKIFPSNHPAVANAQTQGAGSAAQTGSAQGGMAAGTGQSTMSGGGAQQAGAAMQQVDVEEILNGMARNNPQQLNWRTSIVDLMKLLGLDSSFNARKELAQELHYTGDPNDSASMNIWLHKQVMRKLAENGGKVPADLKS